MQKSMVSTTMINNLNFIVLSPWRSGSTLCASLLTEYVRTQTGDQSLYYSGYRNELINEWKENNVYHTHNCNNLDNVPKNFNVIITNRSLFDCAISNIVANRMKKFTYYHIDDMNPQIEPFEIDKKHLMIHLESLNNVRCEIIDKAATIPNPVITIEYVDYKDHNQRLFDILGIDFKLSNTKLIPVKVPLNYREIVLNYHELEKKFRI